MEVWIVMIVARNLKSGIWETGVNFAAMAHHWLVEKMVRLVQKELELNVVSIHVLQGVQGSTVIFEFKIANT